MKHLFYLFIFSFLSFHAGAQEAVCVQPAIEHVMESEELGEITEILGESSASVFRHQFLSGDLCPGCGMAV
jgi:hypothetical protein